jgi:bifunctional DNA-binding transcriptional regulator/antitoxin component of YhaV-PrlF toxin-antitoxin module
MALRSAAVKSLDPKVSRNVSVKSSDRNGSAMGTITMSPNGRRTLPAEVRQRLGLEGETEFDVAWAYTAEHLAAVARALSDIREGRVRRLSDDDLTAYDG